jgi:predicted DNA-binding transcriptional regulator YafY
MTKNSKEIITLALDRIKQIKPLAYEPFQQNVRFDPHTYFSDIVGVTRNMADRPTTIEFLAYHNQAPYIRTKPIHASQRILEQRKEGTIFSISVIPNFELDREFIGFGEGLKIISPNTYVRRIRKKIRLMHELYQDQA